MTTPQPGPSPSDNRRTRTRRRNILLKEGFTGPEIRRLRLDQFPMDERFVQELREDRRSVPDVRESRRQARLAHRRLRDAVQRGALPEVADVHRAARSRARLDVLRSTGIPRELIERYDLDMVQGNNRALRYFLQQWNQLKKRGLTHAQAGQVINSRLRRVTSDPERSGLDLIFEIYDDASLRSRRRAIRRAA